jgi:hypothetical protein
MDAKRIDVKIFATPDADLNPTTLMPIFQRWIQEDKLPGLLIDVADYTHVPDGPAMVLVAHEAQYVYDLAKSRPGLLYSARRDGKGAAPEDFEGRLRAACSAALQACVLLEKETALRFAGGDILVRINDRLEAPNEAATFDKVRPAIEKLVTELYNGSPVSMEPRPPSAAEAFTVDIRATDAPSVTDLAARLS